MRSAQHAPVRSRSAWITPKLRRAPNKACAFQTFCFATFVRLNGYFTLAYVVNTKSWAYQSPNLRNCLGSQRASIRKAGMRTGLRVSGALHKKTSERVSEIRLWLYLRAPQMSLHTRTRCPPAPARKRRNVSRPGGPKKGIKIKSFTVTFPENCSSTGEWSVTSFLKPFPINFCHGNLNEHHMLASLVISTLTNISYSARFYRGFSALFTWLDWVPS